MNCNGCVRKRSWLTIRYLGICLRITSYSRVCQLQIKYDLQVEWFCTRTESEIWSNELHGISCPVTSADGLLYLEACCGFRPCRFPRVSANIAGITLVIRESWKWLWTGSLRKGVRFPACAEISLFSTTFRPTLVLTHWVPKDCFPALKRPESHPSSTAITAWSFAPSRQYTFTALCLIKHRDNFTCA